MESILESLQEAAAGQLREHLCLPGTTVNAQRASDLESQVETAIESAAGLSFIVLAPMPLRVAPSAPGPAFLEIAVTVRVVENLMTNETGAGLVAGCERACQILHLWPLPENCGDGTLRMAEKQPWTIPDRQIAGASAMDLHFLAASSLNVLPGR